tara:strand:- start:59 stop:1168 length:1110 start_codon:yes stop_codon:yes gene_type:complete
MEINITESEVRKICFFCKNEKVINKISILDAPLILGCTKQENSNDKFISFNVFQCTACDLIFTDADLDDVGYSDVHSEAVGKIWEEHHVMFSKFIDLKKNIQTLEIGPSKNPISRKNTTFVDMFDDVPFALQEGEEYVKSRFPNTKLDKRFNRIVASHVFEHSTDPEQFLKKCIEMLDDDGEIFLSIPNFEFWINNKYWNGITVEHQIYPSIKQISKICNTNGLNLKFELFKNHSVFLRINKNEIESDCNDSNNINILEWARSIKDSIKNLEEKITSEGIESALIVGASHISQYPILMSDIIKNITNISLDNSSSKHGMRLYGTTCVCKSFDILKTIEHPTIILFNSPYSEEIINQIESLNSNSKIIEC